MNPPVNAPKILGWGILSGIVSWVAGPVGFLLGIGALIYIYRLAAPGTERRKALVISLGSALAVIALWLTIMLVTQPSQSGAVVVFAVLAAPRIAVSLALFLFGPLGARADLRQRGISARYPVIALGLTLIVLAIYIWYVIQPS